MTGVQTCALPICEPTDVASGDTNYEAGFDAALKWFSDDSNTLDNPDFNQTIFISDGRPNRAYQGDGSTVFNPHSNQEALDHVLGTEPGDSDSEYQGLLGPYKGCPGTVARKSVGEGTAVAVGVYRD